MTDLKTPNPTAYEYFERFFRFVEVNTPAITFTGLFILCLYVLIRLHIGHNKIDLSDLICTDGYLNDKKFRKTGAWVVSTWGFVVLTLADKLAEWYFVGYMAAWVFDAGYDRWIRSKENIALGERAAEIRGDRPPEGS